MKGLVFVAVAGALFLAPIAHARDRLSGFSPWMQAQQGQQGQQSKKDPKGPQRSEPEKRGADNKRPQGRLTEEERRGLHRDLDRANREIYRR